MLIEQAGSGGAADATDPGIPVLRVTHQREKIGNQRRLDPEFLSHSRRIADFLCPAVHLHATRLALMHWARSLSLPQMYP